MVLLNKSLFEVHRLFHPLGLITNSWKLKIGKDVVVLLKGQLLLLKSFDVLDSVTSDFTNSLLSIDRDITKVHLYKTSHDQNHSM